MKSFPLLHSRFFASKPHSPKSLISQDLCSQSPNVNFNLGGIPLFHGNCVQLSYIFGLLPPPSVIFLKRALIFFVLGFRLLIDCEREQQEKLFYFYQFKPSLNRVQSTASLRRPARVHGPRTSTGWLNAESLLPIRNLSPHASSKTITALSLLLSHHRNSTRTP